MSNRHHAFRLLCDVVTESLFHAWQAGGGLRGESLFHAWHAVVGLWQYSFHGHIGDRIELPLAPDLSFHSSLSECSFVDLHDVPALEAACDVPISIDFHSHTLNYRDVVVCLWLPSIRRIDSHLRRLSVVQTSILVEHDFVDEVFVCAFEDCVRSFRGDCDGDGCVVDLDCRLLRDGILAVPEAHEGRGLCVEVVLADFAVGPIVSDYDGSRAGWAVDEYG